MLSDGRSDCTPFQTRECVPQVEIQQHVSLVAGRQDLLQAPSEVDEDVTTSGHATLAGLQEKLLKGGLLLANQSLRNDSAPHLPNPDGPWGLCPRLPQVHEARLREPMGGFG